MNTATRNYSPPTVTTRPLIAPASVIKSNTKARNLDKALKLSGPIPTGLDVWGIDAKYLPEGRDIIKILPGGEAFVLSATPNRAARHGRSEHRLAYGLYCVPAGTRYGADKCHDCKGWDTGKACRHALLLDTVANTPDLAINPASVPQKGIATFLAAGGTVDSAYLMTGHTCGWCCSVDTSYEAHLTPRPGLLGITVEFCAACGFRWRVTG